MAEEEAVEEEGSASGSKKKLIIIIVGVLLLVGIAAGAAMFMLGGDDAEVADADDTETAKQEEEQTAKEDATYIDLKPPFTVNLDPDDPVGFLQVEIQVLTYFDDVAAEVEKHKPLIRNNLVRLFSNQKSADLRSSEGKAALQKLVLEEIQSVIEKYGSGGEIENVFFTAFVMQ